jgi:hypothetical protein
LTAQCSCAYFDIVFDIMEHVIVDEPLTLSVPEAGKRYFGLSRNGSYAAAEDGTIPTIRVGKLLRVPIRAMERMLDAASLSPTKDRSRRAVKKRKPW